MDNIAKLLGFSNDKSAKSQAAKCRGELRKLFQSSFGLLENYFIDVPSLKKAFIFCL